jgi:hypothetical protein
VIRLSRRAGFARRHSHCSTDFRVGTASRSSAGIALKTGFETAISNSADGAIPRFGKPLGLAPPVNDTLVEIIRARERRMLA